jgi:hypothetical protein
MFDMLASWSAGAVIALVAVIGFAVWMIVLSITDAWKKTCLAELEAVQKREYLQRGLSVEEIERLLRASRKSAQTDKPSTDRELEASLASTLVQYEVSAETMEQVLKDFQSIDPAGKEAAYNAISEMLEAEADEEQLTVAVRMMCRSRDREAPVAATS